ncbi:MAG: hypothetical protein EXR93_08105 [Gemmatimonadetes bacterium]|nr:hypothetical protein [Gemmatimonadota bacterium]
MTVRKLLQERLTETQKSADELAAAVDLPAHYVTDLLAGKRRPPLPTRTDVYEKMTRFLKLGRTDLADCARAERAASNADRQSPDADVQTQILDLCSVDTAKALKKRARSDDDAEMIDLIGRVLIVVQGNARRSLDDQIPLRIAATRTGASYPEMRLRVLEFLDTSPGTLSIKDLIDFVRPQIASWDVDFDTGVLKVILRPAHATERHRRNPIVRTGRARLAG